MRLGSVAALRFHTFPSLLPHFLLTVSTPIYAQGTGWAGADLSLYVGSDTLVASNLTLPPGYSFAIQQLIYAKMKYDFVFDCKAIISEISSRIKNGQIFQNTSEVIGVITSDRLFIMP